ncbi:MAG TPA: amidohydrolase family protein [Candidatus Dormibacteraeota bacterium]|nr:amidohydrolase family protein [Candidatus Dormibacteraeota bacterium]
MIVDAHHHFWDPAKREYVWMGPELAPIRRRFGPEDMRPLLADNGVDWTVLVQTVSSVDETREFLDTAAGTDFVGGVVGWVDLTSPTVGETIAALVSDLLVGVRHQVHDEPDPGWLLRDDVQRGIAAVGAAGLVYDLLVRARELPAALQTVRRHRDMLFVLDHAAKPRIAGGSWDAEWENAMAPLSDEPNVACKLSGLVTEADWMSWTPEQLEPYVKRVVGWFGRERCMFGSDWPVCLLAASYAKVLDTMQQIVGLDDWIFGNTARRVYGLPEF